MKNKPRRLIRMDFGCFGYLEGYQRFKDGLDLVKYSKYKAKWRDDAFNLGLEMGYKDAKKGKKSAVYIYNPTNEE